MKNAAISLNSELEKARALTLPSRQDMLVRSPSVQAFWNNNQQVLANAWHEWEQSSKGSLLSSGETLLDDKLRSAVNAAWQDPTTENLVKDLWQEAALGVYTAQFFSPDKLSVLRQYIDSVATADIPLRPPYGIVLNRHGRCLTNDQKVILQLLVFRRFTEYYWTNICAQ
jgi:hypothetical protein